MKQVLVILFSISYVAFSYWAIASFIPHPPHDLQAHFELSAIESTQFKKLIYIALCNVVHHLYIFST